MVPVTETRPSYQAPPPPPPPPPPPLDEKLPPKSEKLELDDEEPDDVEIGVNADSRSDARLEMPKEVAPEPRSGDELIQ